MDCAGSGRGARQYARPQAGIEAVNAIQNLQSLESYYLLHAVLGEFESRLNHAQAAVSHFRKFLQLAEAKSEQAFLEKRLPVCEGGELRP